MSNKPPSSHKYLETFGSVRRKLSQRLAKNAASLGMGPRQIIALRHIQREQTLSMSALGDILAIDPAAVTRMVASMEKAGWVKRKINAKDRRQAMVTLSPRAVAKMPQIDAIYDALSEKMVSFLNKKERALFLELLKRVDMSLASENENGT